MFVVQGPRAFTRVVAFVHVGDVIRAARGTLEKALELSVHKIPSSQRTLGVAGSCFCHVVLAAAGAYAAAYECRVHVLGTVARTFWQTHFTRKEQTVTRTICVANMIIAAFVITMRLGAILKAFMLSRDVIQIKPVAVFFADLRSLVVERGGCRTY